MQNAVYVYSSQRKYEHTDFMPKVKNPSLQIIGKSGRWGTILTSWNSNLQ